MKRLSVTVTFLCVSAFAQTPLQVTPYQILDARTGQAVPCVGCQVFTYAAGTVTPLATYTDSSLTTVNSNPVLTDSAGYASNGTAITGIWVGLSCYKIILKDSAGVTIWTQDHLCPAGFQTTATLYGLDINQNNLGSNGGYINFKPVNYNPYDGPPCYDKWGNPVQQPLPAPPLPGFGPNDLVLWNSLSPSMPPNGSCGVPLPVNLLYGLNTNGYFFARGGLATDQTFFNSIQSLEGGVTAGSFTAGIYYPSGTVTTTGTLSVGAYLGGYMFVGHSAGPPAVGTIATTTNPLVGGQFLDTPGLLYYDTTLNCFNGFNGTAFSCLGGGGGGGSPSGPVNSVQISGGASFSGNANFVYNPTISQLLISRLGASSGVISPIFNANVTGVGGASTFLNSDGSYSVTGTGNIAAQALALQNGWTAGAGAYSLTGSGMLTVASCSGCGGGGGGGAAGPLNSIQYNTGGGVQGGATNLSWNNVTSVLTLTGTVGGFISPIFNANAGGTSLEFQGSNVSVRGDGHIATNGWLDWGPRTAPTPVAGHTLTYYDVGVGYLATTVGGATPSFYVTPTGVISPLFNANAGGTSLEFQGSNFSVTGQGKMASNGWLDLGERAAPSAAAGHDILYADAGTHQLLLSLNGGGFAAVSTGGGGGTPGGSDTNIQFNSAGAFGGSNNFGWDNTLQLLAVTGIINTASLAVHNGFTQSDGGFVSTSTNQFNAFHTTGTAGMAARSFTATGYVQTGRSAGAPAPGTSDTFVAGTVYWDTTALCEEVYNGSSFSCLGASYTSGTGVTVTGSVISIGQAVGTTSNVSFGTVTSTGLFTGGGSWGLNNAGALTVNSCTGCGGGGGGVTSLSSIGNGLSFTSSTGSVTAILAQNIGTSGTPTFSNVTAGLFNCSATGGSSCIQQASGFWRINGQGDFLGQSITTGSNNGVRATGGGGAVFSKGDSSIGMFEFDTGGACGIGTGESAPGIFCTSDARLKTPGINLADSLEQIMSLRPVTFNWLGNGKPGVGFIAQEVQAVIPELVTAPAELGGYLMLSQEGMIPYLVRAVQQLQNEISELKGKLNEMPSVMPYGRTIAIPVFSTTNTGAIR